MPDRRPIRSVCAELGVQFAGIMQAAAGEDRTAASAIGIDMVKTGDRATVTISREAADQYFDPRTGNSLGFILDEITIQSCPGELNITIHKSEDGSYLVVQRFGK